ncbi:MAG: heme ABC exporter ATP-binding protein CcmA [Pseudomonadota bacterium]
MRLTGRNLACERGGRPVFTGLSFAVAAGEALSLMGPNGSGKSTLLRLIAGLLHPIEGQLTLDGGQDDVSIGEQCHYLGHLDALKPALTVAENVAFWRAFFGATGRDVAEALDAVRLGHASTLPAGFLSAGQRRRAALARLLVSYRPIWLLDEPTSALDTASQARLHELVRAHLGAGGIVIAATHQHLPFSGSELRLESDQLEPTA